MKEKQLRKLWEEQKHFREELIKLAEGMINKREKEKLERIIRLGDLLISFDWKIVWERYSQKNKFPLTEYLRKKVRENKSWKFFIDNYFLLRTGK